MSARSAHDSLGSNLIGNANKFDGSNCSVNNEERNKQTQTAREEDVEIKGSRHTSGRDQDKETGRGRGTTEREDRQDRNRVNSTIDKQEVAAVATETVADSLTTTRQCNKRRQTPSREEAESRVTIETHHQEVAGGNARGDNTVGKEEPKRGEDDEETRAAARNTSKTRTMGTE